MSGAAPVTRVGVAAGAPGAAAAVPAPALAVPASAPPAPASASAVPAPVPAVPVSASAVPAPAPAAPAPASGTASATLADSAPAPAPVLPAGTAPAPAPVSPAGSASATASAGEPAPVPSGARPGGPAPVGLPAGTTAPGGDRPAGEADRALDFGRISGARVGAVAVPVAAVVRVARRKNVIGAETTGSIPVHLLFRDGPESVVPGAAGDDPGPDTVSMAAPTPPAAGRKPAIPAPSKVQAEPQPQLKPRPRPQAAVSRPAPTADPALVERPGPVLPGWVGVVAGALALAWCAALVWWVGAVPAEAVRMLRLPARPYHGIPLGQWALLALGVVLALFSLGGLSRGRVGYAWVLTLFGDYRGTVRRTGLVWVSPLLLRRRVDVRLRHWRSEPLSAVDAKGTALDVTVLVVWRVRDTVRASLGVEGHEDYLREQVEAAMARVLSQLPADAFHEDAPTLRDAEAVGEALTRMLSAECAPVGVDVFSAQPTRIEYAPEVAAAMRRRRIAAIDAKHRDSVLTSVVDAVDDVVHRLTSRGLVELDDYERKTLVKDLTVAFYTGRTGPVEGA
ncbi:SPFH domain-containing protein [Streptomyces vietnamensis]|uniref:SPFH domain-containing protein n=1 Tax=Streptomyces vietnamensis TaxID=362257 RepID=UPI0037AED7BE